MAWKVGDRIRLVRMIDDPDPITPGTCGTVDFVSQVGDWTQIGVEWDNGRSLMVCVPPDRIVSAS
jgi:Domain of unknown function (DUF4314)